MMPSEPRRLTPAELARTLNVSRQAINDLQNAGALPREADGLIDLGSATAALAARLHPNSKTLTAIAALSPPATVADLVPPGAADDSAAPVTSYHVARTLREAAEARMAQLKLAEMNGTLVKADDVGRQARAIATALRLHLDTIPERIAAELGTDDATRRTLRERIRAELDAAMLAAAAVARDEGTR